MVGFVPAGRHRSRLALTLAEREVISRGVTTGTSQVKTSASSYARAPPKAPSVPHQRETSAISCAMASPVAALSRIAKVQGRKADDALRLLDDACRLQEERYFALVLEGIPAEFAARATRSMRIPTSRRFGSGIFGDFGASDPRRSLSLAHLLSKGRGSRNVRNTRVCAISEDLSA